jgi:phosphoglycerol transferase MdoB-like AlkP superfamily enzyme
LDYVSSSYQKFKTLISNSGCSLFHMLAFWWQRALGRSTFRMLLAVVVLNAPFWQLASHIFLTRAPFSIDVLLALLVVQFSPIAGAVLIAMSWACDLLVNTSSSYYFSSVLEFMRSIAFATAVDYSSFVQAKVLVSFLPFVAAAVALKKLRLRMIGATPILMAMLILIFIDGINGSSALSTRDVRLLQSNVAGSSLYAIARAVLSDNDESALRAVRGSGGWTEFNGYLPSARSADNGVLYVVVESLGVHRHPAIQAWLRDQLFPVGLRAAYNLREGNLEAHGGTTSGELRRLCGLQGSYRRFDKDAGQKCLPNLFAQDGWSTLGLHGFSEQMFDRRRWWPMLGLQDVRFAEQLLTGHARQCGAAFHGMCDDEFIATAVAAAAKPRSFVYALTLNTHLPLAPTEFPPDLAAACEAASTGTDVCTLLAHLGITLRALAQGLSAQESHLSVMIVGDHAPPFIETRSRQQFLRDIVQAYALAPRRKASSP